LNWNAWGRSMRSIMEHVLNRPIDPGHPRQAAQPTEVNQNSDTCDSEPGSAGLDEGSAEVTEGLVAGVSRT